MIIGIVGTRRRDTETDYELVKAKFFEVYSPSSLDIICSGGCPKGADRFAARLWKEHSIPYLEFPAKWRTDGVYNPKAGFERNTQIAEWSDILIACVAPDRTGGTEDTIAKFLKRRTENYLILV
jgi:hypothetical protein